MTYQASKASHEQTERDSEIGTDNQPTMPEEWMWVEMLAIAD